MHDVWGSSLVSQQPLAMNVCCCVLLVDWIHGTALCVRLVRACVPMLFNHLTDHHSPGVGELPVH
jgi:hypothetical protein